MGFKNKIVLHNFREVKYLKGYTPGLYYKFSSRMGRIIICSSVVIL